MRKHYLYSVIAIVAINIGFYYGLILPHKAKADSIFKEIEVKRAEMVTIKPSATFSEIKADITKFKDMLPRKAEMTNIIREIDGLAKGASLAIHDITYESKKTEEGGIFQVSFSFPVEGKYVNIKNLIYKLESSRRMFTIDSLSLEKASGKEDIRLKIRMSAYLKS